MAPGWLFFSVMAMAATSAHGNFTISANPTILRGSEIPLKVVCDFSLVNMQLICEDIDVLVSLRISKESENNSEILASKTAYGSVISLGEHFKGTAAGNVQLAAPESHLEITIEAPTQEDAGLYVCSASTSDSVGLPVPIPDVNTEVFYQPNTLEHLTDLIIHLEKQLESLNGQCAPAEGEISLNNEKLKIVLTKLEAGIVLVDPDIISRSGVFETSVYLAVDSHMIRADALSTCKRYGGYFAEINTREEYEFALRFLTDVSQQFPEIDSFATGAHDDGKDITFETNIQDPAFVNYGEWDSAGPGGIHNTVIIKIHNDTHVGMDTGHPRQAHISFLCEVRG